jgi:hypothetical protein
MAPKNYIIDTADFVYEPERVNCKNLKSEVRFKLWLFIAKLYQFNIQEIRHFVLFLVTKRRIFEIQLAISSQWIGPSQNGLHIWGSYSMLFQIYSEENLYLLYKFLAPISSHYFPAENVTISKTKNIRLLEMICSM